MEAEATEERIARRSDILERVLEFDFTRPLAFAALAVVYVATRIPWLNLGYGTDPDAWRVALSADHLLSHGEYLPSRLPGFPLEEFVTVPFVRAGWVWTNLSTVLVSLVGVYLFARLLVELKLPAKGVLTAAFAFTPLLWINSVITMDYMWSLTFILACYLALMRRRSLLGGLFMGLAIGFRLTAFWVAFAFIFWLWREKRLRSARAVPGAMAAVSLVAYSPVLATYGLRMFNFYDAKISFAGFLKLLGKDTLGVVGALAVLAGLALSLPRLKTAAGRLPREQPRRAMGRDAGARLRVVHAPAARGRLPDTAVPLRLLPDGALLPAAGAGGGGAADRAVRLRRHHVAGRRRGEQGDLHQRPDRRRHDAVRPRHAEERSAPTPTTWRPSTFRLTRSCSPGPSTRSSPCGTRTGWMSASSSATTGR